MTDSERGTEFEHTLAVWVKAALARGVRSFPDLVSALPGAYPADVARAIERLKGEPLPAWTDGLFSTPRLAAMPAGWPVEHPLDFDWRFTLGATRFLLDRCGTGLSVAFLGAPSLAREAAKRDRRGEVVLFDRNPCVVTAVRATCPGVTAVCTDLLWDAPVEVGDAAVSVADPPWYPEHTAAFLWAAARLTRVGGRVLISLPPEGTRPGILAERSAILGTAATFGLQSELVEPGVLAYQMPPFERNALAAAGVPAVADDWRRGDLAVFVVTEKAETARPISQAEPDGWGEESVGTVRIKCRVSSAGGFQDPTLSQVVPGDMLPTVSRRHPARAAVDVWTSGNRVFRCSGSGIFRQIVSAIGRFEDAEAVVSAAIKRELAAGEAAKVRRAAVQAADLIRREAQELAEYGHRCLERDLAEAV